jgi:hypothetical protein
MSRKNVFVLLSTGVVGIVCIVAIRSQVKDHNIVTYQSARRVTPEVKASQVVNNDTPQLKSPTGRHFAFHGPYDPYKVKPDPLLFTIVDTKDKSDIHVPIEWPARYVSSVDWVDDRFVLAHGEGAFLAIIDVASGRQTHSLVGYNFSVAPNNKALAYRYDFNPLKGEISPYRQSDYVLLTYLGEPFGAGLPKDNYRVVYPELLTWGNAPEKFYTELETRHQVVSTLVWSSDSKIIAFAENNEHSLWITILTFKTPDDVSPTATRFKLDGENKQPLNLSWLSLTTIGVTRGDTNWIVDITSGLVTHQS